MRYSHSKQQSAELLRLGLARMAQHDAAMNPHAYAVWYEYLAGINPRLSQAVDARLNDAQPIDDETVERLYREHISDVDEETAQRITSDFNRVMQQLSDSAETTNQSATTFTERLGSLQRSLSGGDDSVPASVVGDAIGWTTRMQQAVDGLQHQVAASRLEVERLREDLHRTREESLRCPLTRVLNRKGFDLKMQELLSRSGGKENAQFLVMVDIDHFKRVNDDHGHLVGDRVLEGIGELLLRTSDSTGASAARYGGEEFALVLQDLDLPRAVAVAEAVRSGAKRMRIRQRSSDKTIVTVTVSAGVAMLKPQDDVTALVARADEALYRSKQSGRDRVTVAPH